MKRRLIIPAICLAVTTASVAQPSAPDPQRLVERLHGAYDAANGGFGAAPKSLQPLALHFLLRQAARGNRDARVMAVESLRAMSRGAIHDQVGGGFFHSSADAAWRMPLFEKRLSDQALLAVAYAKAWQLTHEDEFQRVARRTLDYALRDLGDKNGSFRSGQVNESLIADNGPRMAVGRVYGWNLLELRKVLGKNADLIVYYFGLKDGGNVPESVDPQGLLRGLSLPYVAHTDTETRARFGMGRPELVAAVDASLAKMQLVRSHRPQATRDAATPTGGTALMASALATAGALFDDPHYIWSAEQTARYLEALYDRKTKRLRSATVADDYALVVQALIDVYQTSFNPRWLKLAIELQQRQDELFWDGAALRYTAAANRDADLPDGNAVAAMNLMRLAAATGSAPWQTKADAILRSFAAALDASPEQLPDLADAFAASQKPARLVVICRDVTGGPAKDMLAAAHSGFDPLRIVVMTSGRGEADPLAAYVPAVVAMKAADAPTASVCRAGTDCSSAAAGADRLEAALQP